MSPKDPNAPGGKVCKVELAAGLQPEAIAGGVSHAKANEREDSLERMGEAVASIPARLFQTWKSKLDIPEQLFSWSASFRLKNPQFCHELWDDVDNRRFICREFPWFLETYDGYPAEIYRADAVRYFYLYVFGGIYADMDTECLKPLDQVLTMADVVLCRMGPDPSFSHSIPNAIMASKPRQEFWLLMMALLCHFAHSGGRPERQTGSILLKTAVDLYLVNDPQLASSMIETIKNRLRDDQQPCLRRSAISLLNSRAWYPIDWSDPIHLLLRRQISKGRTLDEKSKAVLFGDAWMVTYWAHTWEQIESLSTSSGESLPAKHGERNRYD